VSNALIVIAVVLIVLWVIGLFLHIAGRLIHLLLPAAIVVLVIALLTR
jgi:hypothetical protein